MNLLDISAVLLSLAAVFGFLNLKLLKLPNAIGIMLLALIASLVIIFFGREWPQGVEWANNFVGSIEFDTTVMEVMLSFLLFAGALHVNLDHLREQKGLVLLLATVGLLISTAIVGGVSFYLFQLFGVNVPLAWCFVFGSLISPTDPVAVLGILKTAGVPKSLETKITGESLFNDGVAVVLYLVLVGIAAGTGDTSAGHTAMLFLEEVGGGLALGFGLGLVGYFMLKSIDNYQVEILITLALVTGGYQLCYMLHFSGPLAMVVAGLMIGNQGRLMAMSDQTRKHLDLFWELIDEILNALLFLLIGLEVFILTWNQQYLLAGGAMIVLVLLARFTAVSLPVYLLKKKREFTPGVRRILTWGGLRGGISVALALALPKTGIAEGSREAILVATYMVVIFSIAVQGLTLKPLVVRLAKKAADKAKPTLGVDEEDLDRPITPKEARTVQPEENSEVPLEAENRSSTIQKTPDEQVSED